MERPDEPNVRPRPDGPFKRHFHAATSASRAIARTPASQAGCSTGHSCRTPALRRRPPPRAAQPRSCCRPDPSAPVGAGPDCISAPSRCAPTCAFIPIGGRTGLCRIRVIPPVADRHTDREVPLLLRWSSDTSTDRRPLASLISAKHGQRAVRDDVRRALGSETLIGAVAVAASRRS
jgi:hypothetical protein